MKRRAGRVVAASTTVAAAALMLAVVLLAAWGRQENGLRVIQIIPTLTNRPELCLTCHNGIEEISPSHPIAAFGCTTCHGGDGLALDAGLAHAGMHGGRNPADLAVVNVACGGDKCHSGDPASGDDHIQRVTTSIQATYAGAISQVRHAFGAQPGLAAQMGIHAVQDALVLSPKALSSLAAFTPGTTDPQPLQQFAVNCVNCHLSAQPIAQPYFYRSTGCSTCHVLYDNDGLYKGGDPTISRTQPGHASAHRLTTAIPYTQCDHCHNRGNYNLPTMAFVPRSDLPLTVNTGGVPVPAAASPASALPVTGNPDATAQRLADLPADRPVHSLRVAADCIDCHTVARGHGRRRHLQPRDRRPEHPMPHLPRHADGATQAGYDRRSERRRIASGESQRPLQPASGRPGRRQRAWEKLGNVRAGGNQLVLTMKVTGQTYPVPLVQGSTCKQKPDEQASHYCHECHAYQH